MRVHAASFALAVSLAATAAAAEQAPPASGSRPGAARPAPAGRDAGSAAKDADIRRLLELTGATAMGEQVLDQMMTLQQRNNPDVPAEIWKELRNSLDAGELGDLIAGVWDRHFTHDDIKGLIAFYESPLGARLLAAQPLIVQESMIAGEAWGRRSAEKVFERLRQKGYPKKST
jgi:hypothetical protein